jgi:chromosome segregation ATPase
MVEPHWLDLFPRTPLALAGWLIQWSYLLIGIGVFISFLLHDSRERKGGGAALPDADALRNRGPETLSNNTNRPILYHILRTLYSRSGYIQEEEITATLEENILSRGESLRDLAALSILTALLFTFLMLYFELRGSVSLTSERRLSAVFDLVGVNWPGILAALVCTFFAGIVRQRNAYLFNHYRNWLDLDIFPKVSAARTTVDQLGTLTAELKSTVEKLTVGLQPLGQLPTVLGRFQDEVIGNLVPKLVDGMQRVPVSLSDATVQQLRKLSGDSNKLIAQITRDYGKLVLLSEQSERRQTEIAAGITNATTALHELKTPLDTILTALADYGKATTSISTELRDFASDLKTIADQFPKLTTTMEQAGAQVNALSRPLDDATAVLTSVRTDLAGVAVNVAGFTTSLREVAAQATSLGAAVSRILAELAAFSPQLDKSTATISTRLTSLESVLASGVANLQAISNSTIGESAQLRTTLDAVHRVVSTAQQSLITSANELFGQAARAREAERTALLEAGVTLQHSTKSLESKISDAARILTDALGQTGKLSGKINAIGNDLVNLDRDTRGRNLLRRVFHAGDSQ